MGKETAELKISKARIQLLLTQPFFGSLLLYLEPVMRKPEEMTIPTMATDGTHLFYCEDFVMSLPGDQLQTVMIHEVCHIALCHLSRVGGRTPMRWNWAADFAANDLIASTTDSSGRKIFTPLPGWLLNDRVARRVCRTDLHQTAGTAARRRARRARRARREARTGTTARTRSRSRERSIRRSG